MNWFAIRLLSAFWLCNALGVQYASASDLTVFAAASLKEALDDVVSRFEQTHDLDVTVSYAGSSTLARQIEFGAPADLFISANSAWMDRLEAAGRTKPESRVDLLGNRLVLIGQSGKSGTVYFSSKQSFTDALGEGKLAMALYDAVPAGIYGKAALERLGIWEIVADRVAQTDNVRAAMALVALRAAPLGIVYETDAKADPRVVVMATFPKDSHPTITYPAAIVRNEHRDEAQSFFDYLQSPDAGDVFASYGFLRPTE